MDVAFQSFLEESISNGSLANLTLLHNGSLSAHPAIMLAGGKPVRSKVLLQVSQWMNYYFMPVIIVVGLFTNVISIAVFVTTYLRRQSSSVYLTALNVSDSGFLLMRAMEWLSMLGYHLHTRPGWCQAGVYLTHIFAFLSAYYVVALTVERYLVITYPFRRQDLFTTRKAKFCVVGLAIAALLLYIWSPFMTGVVHVFAKPSCMPVLHQQVDVLLTIDTAVTVVIPSLLITCLNVRIGLQVRRAMLDLGLGRVSSGGNGSKANSAAAARLPAQSRAGASYSCTCSRCQSTMQCKIPAKSLEHLQQNGAGGGRNGSTKQRRTSGGRSCTGGGPATQRLFADTSFRSPRRPIPPVDWSATKALCNTNPEQRRHPTAARSDDASTRAQCTRCRTQLKTTRMLLVVTTTWVLLNLPSHVLRVHAFLINVIYGDYNVSNTVYHLRQFSQFLYYCNFGVNFWTYSLSSKKFRVALKSMCSNLKSRCKDRLRCLGQKSDSESGIAYL